MHKEFAEVLTKEKYSSLPKQEKVFDSAGDPAENSLRKEEAEALLMNRMGIAALTIAFKDNPEDDCLAMIMESKNKEWPSGECHVVVRELLEEYAPDDVMGQVDQRRELEAIHMGKFDNPKTLFSQITTIENKYRGRCSALTDTEKLCTIVCRAPSWYQQTIHTARTIQISKDGKEPSLKDLRKQMYDYYKASRTARKKNGGRTELNLYAGDDDSDSREERTTQRHHTKGKKKPKRNQQTCYKCGKTGHIKRDCPVMRTKSSLQCGHCGKKGHNDGDCWKKHPDKKPKWLKNKEDNNDSDSDEVAGIVVDGELTFAVINDEAQKAKYTPCLEHWVNVAKDYKVTSSTCDDCAIEQMRPLMVRINKDIDRQWKRIEEAYEELYEYEWKVKDNVAKLTDNKPDLSPPRTCKGPRCNIGHARATRVEERLEKEMNDVLTAAKKPPLLIRKDRKDEFNERKASENQATASEIGERLPKPTQFHVKRNKKQNFKRNKKFKERNSIVHTNLVFYKKNGQRCFYANTIVAALTRSP
jgi:hypothetical protein